MITRQQIRAVLADGGRMIDTAGRAVGRIVDVLLDARTSQPAWLTVHCPLCSGIEVVVPLAGARLLDGCVQVHYTAADVCGAPRADGSDGRLDPRQVEELCRYYAALDDGVPGRPHRLTDRRTFAAPPSAGPETPAVAPNSHRRTDVFHLVSADPDPFSVPLTLDALPVIPGLEIRRGNDGPSAYPASSSGPWPPLSTSSPGPPWWQRRQWRWPSALTSVRMMRLELRPVLDMSRLPDDELEDLVLAAGEAATNAVEHARVPALPFFDVLTEVGEERARIVIQDHGLWRTPTPGGDRGHGLKLIGLLTDATLTVGLRGTTVALRNRPGFHR